MRKCIGIDFGSSRIRAFSSIKNSYFEEAAVTAVENRSKKLLCFGDEAENFCSRAPGSAELRWLIKENPVPGTDYITALMRHVLDNIYGKHIAKPDVAVTKSGMCGDKEESLFADAAAAVGVHDIYLVDSLTAAAYGSNAMSATSLVVNIGASKTEVGIFNRGKLVREVVSSVAGTSFDNALADHLYNNKDIIVSDREAENIKITRATLSPASDARSFLIKGIDKHSGLPNKCKLHPSDFPKIFEPVTDKIIDIILKMLDSASYEPDRIVITGGTANLQGLDEVIYEAARLPVFIADSPSDSVILGMEMMNEKDLLI